MSTDLRALTALRRFGLGPRPGDIALISGDPRGALLEELSRTDAAILQAENLLPSQKAFLQYGLFQLKIDRAALMAPPPSAAAAPSMPPAMSAQAMAPPAMAPPAMTPAMDGKSTGKTEANPGRSSESIYEQEVGARLTFAATRPAGFTERLVMFWSNHFCISPKDGNIRAAAGAYEREAIRPHITGKFSQMLVAAEQHPAMLIYLDNNLSSGPNSLVGLRDRQRGLNENLAREALELHTLGVHGGYTQQDVTSLARILTGWTVISPLDDASNGGGFAFSFQHHEPGDQLLLGQVFRDGGEEQGVAAFEFLARHPATARHIAQKFATYFVADEPPASLVAKLENSFRATSGDLGELARTLLMAPESWEAPAVKLRSPQEFIFAAARLTGQPDQMKDLIAQLSALAQPLWQPNSPEGYGSRTADWLSPNGLNSRLDVADQIARTAPKIDVQKLVASAFGDSASEDTQRAVRRAETREQAIALLLMSPEFQRR